MGSTSSQIEQEIRQERTELGNNIQELQERVKITFDWRHQIDERPLTILGMAVGGGILLAMFGRRQRSAVRSRAVSSTEYAPRETVRAHAATQQKKQQAWNSWDKIKAALIGLGTERVTDFLGETIPGFREEYRRTDTRRGGSIDDRASVGLQQAESLQSRLH